MKYTIPYTFWYTNGINPEDWKKYQNQEAFETFLIKVLGSKVYERRSQMRTIESAICATVDTIISREISTLDS